MNKRRDFEDELEAEVRERLALMEEPGYEFPDRLGKIDWALITVIPIVCLALLVAGEFL